MDYWCENSPVLTHYHNGVSLLFPPWESLFSLAMEQHKDKIDDPDLLEGVNLFIEQETNHARAHAKFNEQIDAEAIKQFHQYRADILAKRPRNTTLLAAMVCIEHIAASMGRDFIDRYRDETSKPYRLFLWHSKEEIQHKDIAYRVFHYFNKDTKQIHRIANQNLKMVLGSVLKYVWSKCKEEKLLTSPKTWWDITRLVLRVLTSVVIPYRQLFHPNFDPGKVDDSVYV